MKVVLAVLVGLAMAGPAFSQSRDEKVARYVRDMDSSDAKTRATACEEVGKLAALRSAYGKPAVEPMLRLLKDKDADVRAAAAESLGKTDEGKKVAEPLTALLKDDKSDKVKLHAAIGLGLVGPEAKDSIKVLRETAQKARADMNMRLAQACQRAIENINGARKK
jgi:HEAT repeat protein